MTIQLCYLTSTCSLFLLIAFHLSCAINVLTILMLRIYAHTHICTRTNRINLNQFLSGHDKTFLSSFYMNCHLPVVTVKVMIVTAPGSEASQVFLFMYNLAIHNLLLIQALSSHINCNESHTRVARKEAKRRKMSLQLT